MGGHSHALLILEVIQWVHRQHSMRRSNHPTLCWVRELPLEVSSSSTTTTTTVAQLLLNETRNEWESFLWWLYCKKRISMAGSLVVSDQPGYTDRNGEITAL